MVVRAAGPGRRLRRQLRAQRAHGRRDRGPPRVRPRGLQGACGVGLTAASRAHLPPRLAGRHTFCQREPRTGNLGRRRIASGDRHVSGSHRRLTGSVLRWTVSAMGSHPTLTEGGVLRGRLTPALTWGPYESTHTHTPSSAEWGAIREQGTLGFIGRLGCERRVSNRRLLLHGLGFARLRQLPLLLC